MLVDLGNIIAMGEKAPAILAGRDPVEIEKVINGALPNGCPLIFLDNIKGTLESDLVCQAVTSMCARSWFWGSMDCNARHMDMGQRRSGRSRCGIKSCGRRFWPWALPIRSSRLRQFAPKRRIWPPMNARSLPCTILSSLRFSRAGSRSPPRPKSRSMDFFLHAPDQTEETQADLKETLLAVAETGGIISAKRLGRFLRRNKDRRIGGKVMRVLDNDTHDKISRFRITEIS
jgi:hypothetical protein